MLIMIHISRETRRCCPSHKPGKSFENQIRFFILDCPFSNTSKDMFCEAVIWCIQFCNKCLNFECVGLKLKQTSLSTIKQLKSLSYLQSFFIQTFLRVLPNYYVINLHKLMLFVKLSLFSQKWWMDKISFLKYQCPLHPFPWPSCP